MGKLNTREHLQQRILSLVSSVYPAKKLNEEFKQIYLRWPVQPVQSIAEQRPQFAWESVASLPPSNTCRAGMFSNWICFFQEVLKLCPGPAWSVRSVDKFVNIWYRSTSSLFYIFWENEGSRLKINLSVNWGIFHICWNRTLKIHLSVATITISQCSFESLLEVRFGLSLVLLVSSDSEKDKTEIWWNLFPDLEAICLAGWVAWAFP